MHGKEKGVLSNGRKAEKEKIQFYPFVSKLKKSLLEVNKMLQYNFSTQFLQIIFADIDVSKEGLIAHQPV